MPSTTAIPSAHTLPSWSLPSDASQRWLDFWIPTECGPATRRARRRSCTSIHQCLVYFVTAVLCVVFNVYLCLHNLIYIRQSRRNTILTKTLLKEKKHSNLTLYSNLKKKSTQSKIMIKTSHFIHTIYTITLTILKLSLQSSE